MMKIYFFMIHESNDINLLAINMGKTKTFDFTRKLEAQSFSITGGVHDRHIKRS